MHLWGLLSMYILREAFFCLLSIPPPDRNGAASFTVLGVALCHPLKPLVSLTLKCSVISKVISLAPWLWTPWDDGLRCSTHKGSLRGQWLPFSSGDCCFMSLWHTSWDFQEMQKSGLIWGSIGLAVIGRIGAHAPCGVYRLGAIATCPTGLSQAGLLPLAFVSCGNASLAVGDQTSGAEGPHPLPRLLSLHRMHFVWV